MSSGSTAATSWPSGKRTGSPASSTTRSPPPALQAATVVSSTQAAPKSRARRITSGGAGLVSGSGKAKARLGVSVAVFMGSPVWVFQS